MEWIRSSDHHDSVKTTLTNSKSPMQHRVERNFILPQCVYRYIWKAQQAAGDLGCQVTHAY